MADNRVYPKQQLEIVQVQDEKSYGNAGKKLLPVMAKNLSLLEGDPLRGKSMKFTVFNQDLQTWLCTKEIGTRFLCDIEERDRPDSEYGPDRNIVQIYVNNQPVSQKKGGGGGGYRGRTLEEDLILEAVKRRSNEGQTAIAQVGNALTCPTPIPGEDLGIDEEGWARILGKYWQAVEKSLDAFLAQPKGTEPAPGPDQRAQGANPEGAKTDQVPKGKTPASDPIKHVGDLLTRCLKLKPPIARDELCVGLNINDQKEITDLEAAWKTAQQLSATKANLPDIPF